MLRKSHGKGSQSALVRVEVLPADELPAGIPAAPSGASATARAGVRRRANGTVADRYSAAALGRLGAIAANETKRRLAVLRDLGVYDCPANLLPYLADALEFAEAEVSRMAARVGGGEVPPNVESIVQTAALQLAGSRAAFAEGKVELGSKLGNDSRQNLLAAHELCARDAKARPKVNPILARIEGRK